MTAIFPFDVFLSHNSQDKPQVRRLAERLKAAGVRVWFDEWNIKPGDMIALKVDQGLEQSRVLLLCISPNALASGWVSMERSTAIHRDPTNIGRRFIPLLLVACELPDTLLRYKYINFTKETKGAFAELLSACQPSPGQKPLASRPATKTAAVKKPAPHEPQEQAEPLAILECKLTGHTEWVTSVAVSPDGKWAVSGSHDKTTKVWDLEIGECLTTIEGHKAEVGSVAITLDGQQIIVGSRDGHVRYWDSTYYRPLKALQDHKGSILSVSLAFNANRMLTGGGRGDFALRLWEIDTGRCIKRLQGHKQATWATAISEDGKWGLSGSSDHTVRFWNLNTVECLAVLKGHSDAVKTVQFTLDGLFAVSGSEDSTIKVWDLVSLACIGTLEGHQMGVDSVAISPDRALIASTGFTDATVRLWDLESGACLQVIEPGISVFPLSLAFGPGSSRLMVGTTDGPIYVYSLSGKVPALSAEATRRYVNAKIVLLGEGTVGKTSLAHRLIKDEYVIQDRTHGMSVWRLNLPLPPDSTLKREALLWDLAGQEDYRLIHQLFLDETALALLLANPQKEDPFAEAGDWLKALATAAGNQDSKREAFRLLIFSQTDVGGMKLGNAKIERFREQYGFSGWLPTSAKTGENCSDKANAGKPSKLKQLIAESIPWNELPWTSTPRLLAELKSAVMTMRDERDIRLLRFSELAQRLEQALPQESFDESDVRTAVTLLANHGLARPLKFGDLVLLQPELINGYAASIIRSARAHTDEIGCVLETDIYDVEFDFTGVERLTHRPDEELLLRALVQTFLDHSLCIAEETPQGRHLVFPSQYRREKDLPRDPNVFVSYTFSGEWQTVWTTLVVRLWYSNEFEHRELWRNAAEFESGKGHTLGLKIDNQQGEGRATISFYFDREVPDELVTLFIEYAHRHLARYAFEVTRDRRYVCANSECGKPVTDLDAVRKRIEAEKAFIYCQFCDEKVPLMDFIEQRLKSDPIAQKVLEMDEEATRGLDTQALEQILIGHMMAISGEANQIFRPVTMYDYGIDGELEFKDDNGKASGKKIYIQLRSEDSYLRTRNADGREVFNLKNDLLLDDWVSQPVDVFLVIRQTDEKTGQQTIRWMNVTSYFKNPKNKDNRQLIFDGEELDMNAVWKARDEFFPPSPPTRKA